MKYRILIVTFFTLFLTKMNAQIYNNWGQPNQHYVYPDLNKYVGVWKYINNQDTLIVELKKVVDTFKNTTPHFTSESLIGRHRYVKNDTLYDETFSLPFYSIFKANLMLTFENTTPYNNNKLIGTVSNHGTGRSKRLYIEYINNQTLKWTTQERIIPIRFFDTIPSYANPLPTEVVLTKQ